MFTINTLDLVQYSWRYSSDASCQSFLLSVSILPFDFEAGDPGACFFDFALRVLCVTLSLIDFFLGRRKILRGWKKSEEFLSEL